MNNKMKMSNSRARKTKMKRTKISKAMKRDNKSMKKMEKTLNLKKMRIKSDTLTPH